MRLQGKVVEASSGKPLPYATVSVWLQPANKLVGGGLSESNGRFDITGLAVGSYSVRVEFISFVPQEIKGVELTALAQVVNLGTIALEEASEILEEVEVTAERSRMDIKLDKKVFNVEKDLSSIGGTATDVLANVPSVQVDVDGNVSLRGSQNVRILIDGKPSGLVGISASDALRTFPADLVERVEVITNPSARYDAEGMTGIINIVLKKEKKSGTNGSVGLSLGTPWQGMASLNLNQRLRKVNFLPAIPTKTTVPRDKSISSEKTCGQTQQQCWIKKEVSGRMATHMPGASVWIMT
ncbi:MAG: TonB-dependent receptor [Cytophagales bacterium]|nr:TonB-dependent receptor [Cytophagales bacterium]